ncbi:MAG TPA: GNAT family protein [Ignavibacteria bacterium]|nr:GNAT family protein [Ignavibacteria bacterium]
MKNPFLTGKKIYLSPLTKDDITEEYINWLNDKEVCRGNSHATFPNNFAKTLSYVESVSDSKTELAFTVRLKKNDLHIGNASFQNINYINRSAEMAIILGNKNYWNKGISTEILELFIEYGFMTLNLNRISTGTPVTNSGGIKICEKNGMKKEGLLRKVMFKEGKYTDVVIFSILKEEYKIKK